MSTQHLTEPRVREDAYDGVPRPGQPPAPAWRPVLALAGGIGALLLGTSGRIGYSGDELYFLVAGRHLDWGFADQPPLIPLLARTMDTLFPGSVTAIRLPSTVVMVLGVVLAAMVARELGGARRAQLLAAGAYASSLLMWYQGVLLSTSTVDTFLTAVIIFLVVRWVRLRSDRLLLAAGLVTAVTLQAKFLVPIVWVAIGVAALAVGPRDLLRRPLLWVGAAVAVATTVPGLLWQAQHGWPQLEVSQAIAAEQAAFLGGRAAFLPIVLLCAGPIVGAVFACYGGWRLLRAEHLRAYRFLGWACLGLLLFVWAANGRSYYVAGFFVLLWAVAGVELERRRPARWWRWVSAWPTIVASALVPILLLVPVYPRSVAEHNPFLQAEMGWSGFANEVARVYGSLPAHQREQAAVITKYYPRAAALERYGDSRGLPDVYSGHRGYWYFGSPDDGVNTVIAVGIDREFLRSQFERVRRAGEVRNEAGNLVIGHPTIWVCEDPVAPWPQLWPRFRAMGHTG